MTNEQQPSVWPMQPMSKPEAQAFLNRLVDEVQRIGWLADMCELASFVSRVADDYDLEHEPENILDRSP